MSKTILSTLEALRKSASTGIYYAKNDYDRIRYTEILSMTELLYENLLNIKISEIDPIDKQGYITPKVGVNGFIENAEGKLLLEQRSDDKCWGIPGGWAEVGLSAEENVIKEVLEETGFLVEVDALIGIVSRKPSKHYPYTSYHLLYKCRIISGKLEKSIESENVGWKEIGEIDNWHVDHKEWVEFYMERTQNG